MGELVSGKYTRRHPERTDYYRVIESSFDEFERAYPEQFQEKYGFLRAGVMKAIYAYLDCGIPEQGVARVVCAKCGENFFVCFSCRKRIICPCCATKRSILFGEKVQGLTKPVGHLHITFTIPKILRAYLRRNRKLLKYLVQSAHYAVDQYLKEATGRKKGYTGGLYYVQSQGSLYNFHPHIHALALSGVMQGGTFYEQANISTAVIARIFRARLLSVLQKQGIIREELVRMLLAWNHNSGFNVHSRGQIDGEDAEEVEDVARYMSRAAISVERVRYNAQDNTITVFDRKANPQAEAVNYSILEFMALLASHIPSRYESLVYYYGVYSSSYRGKEKREGTESEKPEVEQVRGERGMVEGKVASSWARLIQKIFEVDPLQCQRCGGPMKIIAFIVSEREVKKILKHIHEETIRPPPLIPALVNPDDWEPAVDEYMPDYLSCVAKHVKYLAKKDEYQSC